MRLVYRKYTETYYGTIHVLDSNSNCMMVLLDKERGESSCLDIYTSCLDIYTSLLLPAALGPGQVQNLASTPNPDIPTLTLTWDKPKNMYLTDRDVMSYDIRFKPCGREGNYCKETVVAPATSILLTRESGLKPLTKYDFDVRAQSVFQEGRWSTLSKYIGMCLFCMFKYLSHIL